MAFLIYKKTNSGQTIRYKWVKPVKLSGAGGLIARHVQTLRGEAAASWRLSAAELLRLAGIAPGNLEHAILFDLGDHLTNVCLYEVTGIRGSSRETSTQLALDFAVVVDREVDGDAVEISGNFETPVEEKPKVFGETLALTGGHCGGDWKWDETAMNLGVTVVQARSGRQHNGRKPCLAAPANAMRQ
jgi:hypothetical protein